MHFSGWVPLRRGLIEHLQDGRLTVKEFSVLIGLIMLASKDTGSSTINANTLAAFMGEGLNYESEVLRNRQRGKQRVLQNLEVKRYIYRQIVPHSKRAYRYWVNKYEITDGPNKSRRLDLTQVFDSKDVADIRHTRGIAEGVAHPVAESVAHPVADSVTSNKKEKDINTNKETRPSGTPGNASIGDFGRDSPDYSAKQARREGECASGSASGPSVERAQNAQPDEAHRLASIIGNQIGLKADARTVWETCIKSLLENGRTPNEVQTAAEFAALNFTPGTMMREGAHGFVGSFDQILKVAQQQPQSARAN